MSGLVSYLGHGNPEVRIIAAKAVRHLSSHPGNRGILKKQAGLMDNLVRRLSSTVISVSAHGCAPARGLAARADLTPARLAAAPCAQKQLAADPEDDAAEIAQAAIDNVCPPAKENKAAKGSKAGRKKGAAATSINTIILTVDGIMAPATRYMIERALIQTRGVVSVTIDSVRGQIVACTREEGMEDKLKGILREKGVEASAFQVPTTLGGGAKPLGESNGADAPMYLDDIYPLYSGKNNTVSTYGFSSLEARLEAKRRDEAAAKKKEERAQRFLGSISSGIGSMFSFW